jgi:hypothetical protein
MIPYFVNILPYENAHTIVSGKWLYSLDMEPDKRLKPPIVENILRKRRPRPSRRSYEGRNSIGPSFTMLVYIASFSGEY